MTAGSGAVAHLAQGFAHRCIGAGLMTSCPLEWSGPDSAMIVEPTL